MNKLLKSKDFIEKNIKESKYMKGHNKKQFLIGSKIFSLRCKSATLTARLESRW